MLMSDEIMFVKYQNVYKYYVNAMLTQYMLTQSAGSTSMHIKMNLSKSTCLYMIIFNKNIPRETTR